MAETFGLSASEIISMAGNMGIKLDEATKDRLINIALEGADEVLNTAQKVKDYMESLDGMTSSMKVKITRLEQAGAMGGIVGYAKGGIAGKIPQAASGYIAPQQGRQIPVIAHEGEVILNTSQQKNIAEWIMSKASTRPDRGGKAEVTVNLNNPVGLGEPAVIRLVRQVIAGVI